ncbi:MAG: acylphosphatase [Deltaproteobacteria bacterium]|nr:acylphosphatase [Deltaproteobacteria bacterium]
MRQVRAHVIIEGVVQGVFFRATTAEEAERLTLSGWVRNLSNGNVEAVFEGDEDMVEAILKWCESGPPSASVENVLTKILTHTGEFKGFKVIR